MNVLKTRHAAKNGRHIWLRQHVRPGSGRRVYMWLDSAGFAEFMGRGEKSSHLKIRDAVAQAKRHGYSLVD